MKKHMTCQAVLRATEVSNWGFKLRPVTWLYKGVKGMTGGEGLKSGERLKKAAAMAVKEGEEYLLERAVNSQTLEGSKSWRE